MTATVGNIVSTQLPLQVRALAIQSQVENPVASGSDPNATPPPVSVDTYYATAQGKKGASLLKALSTIVSSGPPKQYTYDQAREIMFGQLDDPRNKDEVTDVYTGRKYSGVSGLRSGVAKGLTAEHVWPQSTGATAGAKTDMHHLITADGLMNSVRGNLPYGDVEHAMWSSPAVPGIREVSLSGTNERGVRVFEPRPSMQGDLARMQLYFFTRYHGDKPKRYTLKNFKESLPALLKWNRADPPDAAERARNDAIYLLQGNRNPYVDHPDWVDKVGFTPEMLRRERITNVTLAAQQQAVQGAQKVA